MNFSVSHRTRIRLGLLLIAAGIATLLLVGHHLSGDGHDALKGFCLGLSAVIGVAGIVQVRRKMLVRRMQESTVRNSRQL